MDRKLAERGVAAIDVSTIAPRLPASTAPGATIGTTTAEDVKARRVAGY